jgi:hypothetical protein
VSFWDPRLIDNLQAKYQADLGNLPVDDLEINKLTRFIDLSGAQL